MHPTKHGVAVIIIIIISDLNDVTRVVYKMPENHISVKETLPL